VFALVVIGPPGVGKTSVVTALHDLLVDDDVAHGVIEIEALDWGHPGSDERAFRHLTSLAGLYKDEGCPLLIVGATATSAEYLAGVVAAIAPDDYSVARLDADPETLRERIVAREPADWSGLPELLDQVDRLAATSRSLADVHAAYPTRDATPRGVATSIRDTFPELSGHE
jgi:GTPase SAR1 family protein